VTPRRASVNDARATHRELEPGAVLVVVVEPIQKGRGSQPYETMRPL